jgi:hypothetical protein
MHGQLPTVLPQPHIRSQRQQPLNHVLAAIECRRDEGGHANLILHVEQAGVLGQQPVQLGKVSSTGCLCSGLHLCA